MSDDFGRLLKHSREGHILTQKQLREALNKQGYDVYSNGTISKWENGKNKPKPEIIECLEDIFSLSRGMLLRPAGYYVEAPATVSNDTSQRSTIITKRLEEHFDRLADMVGILLANGLETITKNDPIISAFPYTLWSGQAGMGIPHKLLSSYLQQNIDQLFLEYNDFDLQNFMSHLEAEYPDIGSEGLRKVVAENPYELIEILRVLARRKTFKGTCSVCEDW